MTTGELNYSKALLIFVQLNREGFEKKKCLADFSGIQLNLS